MEGNSTEAAALVERVIVLGDLGIGIGVGSNDFPTG
jgi:hypothetical protein